MTVTHLLVLNVKTTHNLICLFFSQIKVRMRFYVSRFRQCWSGKETKSFQGQNINKNALLCKVLKYINADLRPPHPTRCQRV